MSLIDDVLVYSDGQQIFVMDKLIKIFGKNKKQVIASSLGRLTAKKLIEKKAGNEFSITESGKQRINSILKNIKIYSHVQNYTSQQASKNSNWQILFFNIPEKQRSSRDIFRNYLINLGFGKIQDSVWASYHDFTVEINELTKILSIQNMITLISVPNTESKDNYILNKIQWDWNLLNSQYKYFINSAEKFLSQKNKDCLCAKKLVFDFAKILQKDPKLPISLQPKNALTNKAFIIYQKIRPYCY